MPSTRRTIPTSEQMLDSILVDPSTSLNPSSDFTPNVRFCDAFQEFREVPDHSVEGSVQSSPSGLSDWSSPSPMPPTGPFNLPHYMGLGEDPNFTGWHNRHLLFPHVHYGGDPTAFHSSFSLPVEKVPHAGDPHVQSRDNHDTTPHSNILIPVAEAATSNEDIHVGNVTYFPTFHSAFSHDVTVDPGHLSQASFPNNMTLSDGQIRPHSPDEAHQLPLAEPFTAQSPRAFPMHSRDPPMGAKDAPDFNKGNPEAIRKKWMDTYSKFVEENNVLKIFSKHAKEKVATLNTLRASTARRKNPAKFKCMIQGCTADFTRKHNLENHLKSHCGVTDRICHRCGKGFTTIPVWRRHQKSCEKTNSSKVSPTSFLDQLTIQHHDSA